MGLLPRAGVPQMASFGQSCRPWHVRNGSSPSFLGKEGLL